jgi:hypothetical protein
LVALFLFGWLLHGWLDDVLISRVAPAALATETGSLKEPNIHDVPQLFPIACVYTFIQTL